MTEDQVSWKMLDTETQAQIEKELERWEATARIANQHIAKLRNTLHWQGTGEWEQKRGRLYYRSGKLYDLLPFILSLPVERQCFGMVMRGTWIWGTSKWSGKEENICTVRNERGTITIWRKFRDGTEKSLTYEWKEQPIPEEIVNLIPTRHELYGDEKTEDKRGGSAVQECE